MVGKTSVSTTKRCYQTLDQKDPEGIPLFNEAVGMAYSDTINTLVFTIIEHFIGTPSELRSRIHDQLSNLRCPTMSDFRWYKMYSFLESWLERIALHRFGKKNSLTVYLVSLPTKSNRF
ncbi:hypothetical protein SLA2020_366910 [Shorea laevis]